MIIVFYDGKCGLCSKEIRHYKAIAPEDIFDWVDINQSVERLNAHDVTLIEGLEQLHVLDDNSIMHVGVDGFIVIWKQLKRWRILAAFVALPIIKQVVQFFYKRFAKWRFMRLEHCQIAPN